MTSSQETSNLAADYSSGVPFGNNVVIYDIQHQNSCACCFKNSGQHFSLFFIPAILTTPDPVEAPLICAALLILIMHASATLVHNLKGHTDEVGRLLFAPDGKTLAASDDSFITLWDVETGSLRSKSEEIDDMYFEMAFSPDSKWIAAASGDGYARIWNAETGQLKHVLGVEDERMLSLVFSADSKLIATGSEIMRVWDVATGELLHTLSVPDDQPLSITAVYERSEYPAEIGSVDFSPDGKYLLSGCGNTSTVCIWNTESWKLEHTIRGYYVACFSVDGMLLAIPTNDHMTIQIYSSLTWQLQSTLETAEHGFFPVEFSPDSKSIVTTSGHEIQIWSVGSGEAIKTFVEPREKELEDFEDPQEEVCTLAFSPNGKVLVSGGEECSLRVRSVENGDLLLELTHKDGARDPWNPKGIRGGPPAVEVLFGDGGGKVAIAFPDGSVRIWDVRWKTT
ncbi:WD40 repeat-like protein, partial [Aureobasidium melanogenum]